MEHEVICNDTNTDIVPKYIFLQRRERKKKTFSQVGKTSNI
jgi:hypothetical protein